MARSEKTSSFEYLSKIKVLLRQKIVAEMPSRQFSPHQRYRHVKFIRGGGLQLKFSAENPFHRQYAEKKPSKICLRL